MVAALPEGDNKISIKVHQLPIIKGAEESFEEHVLILKERLQKVIVIE